MILMPVECWTALSRTFPSWYHGTLPHPVHPQSVTESVWALRNAESQGSSCSMRPPAESDLILVSYSGWRRKSLAAGQLLLILLLAHFANHSAATAVVMLVTSGSSQNRMQVCISLWLLLQWWGLKWKTQMPLHHFLSNLWFAWLGPACQLVSLPRRFRDSCPRCSSWKESLIGSKELRFFYWELQQKNMPNAWMDTLMGNECISTKVFYWGDNECHISSPYSSPIYHGGNWFRLRI